MGNSQSATIEALTDGITQITWETSQTKVETALARPLGSHGSVKRVKEYLTDPNIKKCKLLSNSNRYNNTTQNTTQRNLLKLDKSIQPMNAVTYNISEQHKNKLTPIPNKHQNAKPMTILFYPIKKPFIIYHLMT